MAISHQKQQQKPIKLLSECYVKPKYAIDAAKQAYHLGPVDLIMLSIDPIQKGLLYTLQNAPSFSSCNEITKYYDTSQHRSIIVSHLLEKLKHSLSIALVHFYPLAGSLVTHTYPDENSCSIFVDCNKDPGARFIHATALDLTVSDVLSPIDVTIAHPFFDLGEKYVNYDCHTKALLSIQVTELLDGVFIGFSMSHSVVDGTSFIHFINMLSEIFRSYDCSSATESKMFNISRVPVLNYRPWFSYEPDNEDVPVIKYPFVDIGKFLNNGYKYNPGPLRERIFHFTPTSIAKLKANANQESGIHNVVISSFQALTAFVWKSITRARNLPLDQVTTCVFVIGARSRFDPPISDDYFGNFIRKGQWACKVEELLGNGLGWAAKNMKKVIMKQDGKAILDFYKKFANSPFVVSRGFESDTHGVNPVVMGGSSRFDMYGPEFGLGRALAARMGYGNKNDGKVTANPGCEGGGSVDLEICLKPHIMAALEADQDFMSFVSSS